MVFRTSKEYGNLNVRRCGGVGILVAADVRLDPTEGRRLISGAILQGADGAVAEISVPIGDEIAVIVNIRAAESVKRTRTHAKKQKALDSYSNHNGQHKFEWFMAATT